MSKPASVATLGSVLQSSDFFKSPKAPMFEISVVIPAYNEYSRLPSTLEDLSASIATRSLGSNVRITEVLVIDDGSSDNTLASIISLSSKLPSLRTHRLEHNSGKGAAVRVGFRQARAEWILIADADGSTPWDQLAHLVFGLDSARIAIGSRGMKESRLERRQNLVREGLGKCFNRLVVWVTGLPFKDTQCGFKLIHRPSITPWIDRLRVDRFAWDVEFLMLATLQGIGIIEIPVTWRHHEGSKVRPIRDGFRMVFDSIQIRARFALTSNGSAKLNPP